MADTRPVDDTTAVFADLVYADPDIVQAEFEQIVSGLHLVATCTTVPPRFAGGSRRPSPHRVAPVRGMRHELLERVRAPPLTAAFMAAAVTTTVGRLIAPSLIGRRISHHVDVI